MIRRMSLVDATFLQIETRETPMHIASLAIYQRPEGAPRGFVKNIVEAYRAEPPNGPPWNLKLQHALLSGVVPAIAPTDDIDMDYHVRHTALPEPGGERELGELISHLHGQLLDRARPLWTCHVIDGLERGRFAVYTKIHHSLTDGIKGLHMCARALSATPDGPWSAQWHWQKPVAQDRTSRPARAQPPRTPWRDWPSHLVNAALPNRKGQGEPVLRPFAAPRSVLNGPVTAARRAATQTLDIGRIQAIGRRTKTSFNDVFLALCSSAIRRHLLSSDALPNKPLVASVPVSLRAPGDTDSSNAVALLCASLASDIADPAARLRQIHASMKASKDHLHSLPTRARTAYNFAIMTPTIGVLMTGLGAKVRPPTNVTISNVPGPTETLYLNGAKLEALYPVSLVLQGQSLNITCISYAGQLNVGFIGSRDALPSLQRLAVYASEALDELDAATQNVRA